MRAPRITAIRSIRRPAARSRSDPTASRSTSITAATRNLQGAGRGLASQRVPDELAVRADRGEQVGVDLVARADAFANQAAHVGHMGAGGGGRPGFAVAFVAEQIAVIAERARVEPADLATFAIDIV